MTSGSSAPAPIPSAAELPAEVVPGGRFAAWGPGRPAYVVCDVDGTLVGPHPHASDEVVAAVDRARAAGVRVGLATGRMRMGVQPLLAQLDVDGPHVLHNGAEVRSTRERVAAWTLTPAQVDQVLDLAREREDAYAEIYTDDAFHVSAWDERARPHWELIGREPAGVVERAADLAGVEILKVTVTVFSATTVPDVVAAVAATGLLPGPADSPRTPDLHYVNATHPDADKGRALTRAAAHLGLPLEQVVAVGDADNDLSMLAVAGTAIAMGQASAAVREAAHLVVPSVDDHGVAVALDAVTGWATGS